MSETEEVEQVAGAISLIIKALLVAGRKGAPAEGRIPFNPLYFHLLRILDAQGQTRPSEIASTLSVPRTTVSTAVKALQKRGLLETAPDKSDGRAIVVALTEEGKEVVAAIQRQDRRNAQAMLNLLDPSERKSFIATLVKVGNGVNEGPEK